MLRGRGGSERGSVAITVALAMTVLLGFAALVAAGFSSLVANPERIRRWILLSSW